MLRSRAAATVEEGGGGFIVPPSPPFFRLLPVFSPYQQPRSALANAFIYKHLLSSEDADQSQPSPVTYAGHHVVLICEDITAISILPTRAAAAAVVVAGFRSRDSRA